MKSSRRFSLRHCAFVLAAASCLASPRVAWAQDQTASTIPALIDIQAGPLSLWPRFAIKELGVDSNVFHEAEAPKEDFTGTFTPSLELLLRMGWAELRSNAALDMVYYKKYKDLESIDRLFDARFDVNGTRIRPYVLGGWTDTRSRPNPEIDQFAKRRQVTGGTGAALAFGGRSALTLGVRYAKTTFDQDQFFDGVNLSRVLDVEVRSAEAALRFDLTPLTSLSFHGSFERNQFVNTPERDAESIRAGATVAFSPAALLNGSATVGYRRFRPKAAALASYSGLVSTIRMGYTMWNAARFDLAYDRDVQYSYEPDQPYYLTNGGRLTITQRLVGPMDLQGLAGRQWMSYRAFGAGSAEVRRDTIETVGGGVGFRLGETARLGINYELVKRRSDELARRNYEGRRIYASLRYGI